MYDVERINYLVDHMVNVAQGIKNAHINEAEVYAATVHEYIEEIEALIAEGKADTHANSGENKESD